MDKNNNYITSDIIEKQDHGFIAKWDKNSEIVSITTVEDSTQPLEQFKNIRSKHRALKLVNLLIDKHYLNKLLYQVEHEIPIEKTKSHANTMKNMELYKEYVEDMLKTLLRQINTITK